MVVTEAITGLGAIKSAFDMAKALKDINDATIRNSAVIELQEKILAAREAQTTLLAKIEELERKVSAFEKWDVEKTEYELTEIFDKTFAYAMKPAARGSQPEHLVCAACFEQRKKVILQRSDSARLMCPECKTRIRFGSPTRPTVTTRYNPHRGW